VILIGAPSGDRHSVALSIVADLLRSVGFEVHDLGADVPIESFVRVARELPALRAVGVGVSVGEARAAARELISRLHHEVPGLPVVVGGRGAAELEVGGLGAAEPGAASLGADGCVGDGHFAVATFERVIEACSRS
jgi:methanogenic corrinoid protein MtbC1